MQKELIRGGSLSEPARARRHSNPTIHRRCICKGDTSIYAKGTDPWGELERASEGQEALCPPVVNARRRQKRQHLHRCPTRNIHIVCVCELVNLEYVGLKVPCSL